MKTKFRWRPKTKRSSQKLGHFFCPKSVENQKVKKVFSKNRGRFFCQNSNKTKKLTKLKKSLTENWGIFSAKIQVETKRKKSLWNVVLILFQSYLEGKSQIQIRFGSASSNETGSGSDLDPQKNIKICVRSGPLRIVATSAIDLTDYLIVCEQ